MRWFHILISIPIVGYIYGPVSEIPQAVIAVRYVIFPALALSGLWLWKGAAIKNLKWRTINRHATRQRATGSPNQLRQNKG